MFDNVWKPCDLLTVTFLCSQKMHTGTRWSSRKCHPIRFVRINCYAACIWYEAWISSCDFFEDGPVRLVKSSFLCFVVPLQNGTSLTCAEKFAGQPQALYDSGCWILKGGRDDEILWFQDNSKVQHESAMFPVFLGHLEGWTWKLRICRQWSYM